MEAIVVAGEQHESTAIGERRRITSQEGVEAMDGSTFDALARRFSRRRAMGAVSAGVLAGVTGVGLARTAQAQVSAQDFPRTCSWFAVSGGTSIREDFNYDDDMVITRTTPSGRQVEVFRDEDGQIGVGNLPVPPVIFNANVGDKLRVVVRDMTPRCYSLERLYLHCCTDSRCIVSRAVRRLTLGVERTCVKRSKWKKSRFFDKTYTIA